MANTKKEHYVPRCYLKNFAYQNGEYINVFDKQKMQTREGQHILEVAMENHFYDLNLAEIYKQAKPEEKVKIKDDLKDIGCIDDLDKFLEEIDQQQHIEKTFSNLEGIYSQLLSKLIKKSNNRNDWEIENCYAFSEKEKQILSIFLAIQIIRTKSFRETLRSTYELLIQTLAYKSQIQDPDALPKEDFAVSADKDYIKLQHSSMILDPENTLYYADALYKHTWVMYINKTNTPFYTSDDPVVPIPHKFDKFMSYAGLQSEGVEILFPLSPKLQLGLYDTEKYSFIQDRKYLVITTEDNANYFNRAQTIHSRRFVFSIEKNFQLCQELCTQNPECRDPTPRIEVG